MLVGKEAKYKIKCPDCDLEYEAPKDTYKGEILSCPGCGLEIEVKGVCKDKLDVQEFTHEGQDWGE